jgi:transcription antitermination factor NusA-like protein
MKVCLRCLGSRMLCSKCKAKLDSGEFTQLDVELDRTLHKLSKKNPALKQAEVVRTLDAGSLLIVAGRGSARRLIGNQGQTLREIATEMNRHIRIIEEPRDTRDLLNKLINPSALLGVNVLYTPEGETFRVRVDRSFRSRLPISEEAFPAVAKELIGKDMELVFE